MNALLTDEVLEQLERGQIRLAAIEEQALGCSRYKNHQDMIN
jgi:hypothetical protein